MEKEVLKPKTLKNGIQKKDLELLMVGLTLGLLGGMAGNIIDRYFSHFGIIYEAPVVFTFLYFLYLTERLIKKVS